MHRPVDSPNVKFLLKEGWELSSWNPQDCEVIPCANNQWGVMDWNIQTLVAISDSKYWAEEWLRQQANRPLETVYRSRPVSNDEDIPQWIEDSREEINRLRQHWLREPAKPEPTFR